jgi:hypothetical protein
VDVEEGAEVCDRRSEAKLVILEEQIRALPELFPLPRNWLRVRYKDHLISERMRQLREDRERRRITDGQDELLLLYFQVQQCIALLLASEREARHRRGSPDGRSEADDEVENARSSYAGNYTSLLLDNGCNTSDVSSFYSRARGDVREQRTSSRRDNISVIDERSDRQREDSAAWSDVAESTSFGASTLVSSGSQAVTEQTTEAGTEATGPIGRAMADHRRWNPSRYGYGEAVFDQRGRR